MKVYVVTKVSLFEEEVYVLIKASKKEAEKVIRAEFPNAKAAVSCRYFCADLDELKKMIEKMIDEFKKAKEEENLDDILDRIDELEVIEKLD